MIITYELLTFVLVLLGGVGLSLFMGGDEDV